MSIRILLVDDHTIMRQGLRQILEHHSGFAVVAEAGSGIEAIEQAAEHLPDVAVVDIAMKELNGIEATAQILKRSPETSVLILSMYSDERYVVRAMKAGARRLFAQERRRRRIDPGTSKPCIEGRPISVPL